MTSIQPDPITLLALLDQTESGLILLDGSQRVAFWNAWMTRHSGLSGSAVLGRGLTEVFPDLARSRVPEAVADALRHGLPAVLSPRLNPLPFPLERPLETGEGTGPMGQQILIKPLRPPGQPPCCLIQIQDITPVLTRERQLRSQARELTGLAERIRESETYLRAILDNVLNGILVLDEAAEIRTCNAAIQRIFGHPEADLPGRALGLLIPDLDGWPAERILDPEGAAERDRPPPARRCFEAMGRQRDGTPIPLEIAAGTMRLGRERLIVAIIRDMTQQKHTEQALRHAREAADAANQAKSQFLANMSHDIRTPMNAILGMTDLLEESPVSPFQKNCLEVLRRNGETLLTLINGILDLSRVEAGKMKLERIPFDLEALVAGVVANFREVGRRKGLFVSGGLEFGVTPQREGDPMRLRQVLVNLVGNAVKFTQAGRVTVTVQRATGAGTTPDHVVFQVEDTGIGVAVDKRQAIFDTFSQADSSTPRQYGGSGLGLAICKELVGLMGGEIGVTDGRNGGSLFTFGVPLALDTPDRTAPAPEAETTVDAPPEAIAPLRILLAEDSEDNVLLVQLYLKEENHRLTVVGNGAEAVARFQTERFDLVLMDMQMPVMDGYAATRAMRRWEAANQRAPTAIVALTAFALEEDQARTRAAGCERHVNKPLRKKDLLTTLHWARARPG
ncbi:MAG: PAS domain S-box protein [Magnetococcales bacterium]|nr:PAS domain S-box protein [Magnetococcales bacterium]